MKLHLRLIILMFFACVVKQAKADGIVINEVQVANIDMFVDPSFNYGGWIELFNPSDEDFDLGGCYVSESSENLMQFQLPKDIGIVPAHGFKVLWFDHNSLDGNFSKKAYQQIRFKLNFEGGTVFISDPSGKLLVSQSYPEGITRCSYARKTDGGAEWSYTGEPTLGKTNATSTFATQRVAAPKVRKNEGIHGNSINVRVELEDGVTTVYTTDGTTPTLTNGTVMTKSFISLGKTTVMRFRSFREGFLPSQVVTHTYLFKERNYSLPILSIATDPVNLYDDSIGIEVKGVNGFTGNGQGQKVNFNADWERPVNMEYISPEGVTLLNQEVDMYMCGGYSRGTTPRSFKLKAGKVYEGLNSLDYPFFKEKPYNKYKVLQFRNGGNDSNCRVKDVIIQDIVQSSDVYVDGQAAQAVQILVNGEYYGMLNMREPSNKYNGYTNYGYDVDEMEAFDFKEGKYVQKQGEKTFFEIWEVLANTLERRPEAYTSLRNIVDIDEYANYMAIKTVMGNSDWYTNNNNIKGYRLAPKGKFHMVMFDEDSAFDYGDILTLFSTEKNVFIRIFNAMCNSEDFKRHFITSFCLADGSIFQVERSKEIINRIGQEREAALAIENKSPWSTCNSTISKMESSSFHTDKQKAIRSHFGLGKGFSLHLFSNIPEAQILMNDQIVPTGKYNGKIFIPTTLTATAPAGYEFIGWRKGSFKTSETVSGSIYSTERTIELPVDFENCNLMATFSSILDEHLIAAGSTPVVINEISAGNSIFLNDYFKKNDWIELYNTTDKDIDLTGMYLSDDPSIPHKYQISLPNGEVQGGALIPAHGYFIIWADKLDPISQLHCGFKLSNSDDECVILTAADDSWSDTLIYPAHDGTQSVGRFPDAGPQVFKMHRPTIAKHNTHTTYDKLIKGENVNFDPETLPIENLFADETVDFVEYYTVDGIQLDNPRRGVNILRIHHSDGTTSSRKTILR